MRGLPVAVPLALALWGAILMQPRYALAFACALLSAALFRAFYDSVHGG